MPYKCIQCGKEVGEEEVIWARWDGTLSTDNGDPYCQSCLPEQPNYDEER